MDDNEDGACGYTSDREGYELRRAAEHKARLRETTRSMALDAGFGERHLSDRSARANGMQEAGLLASSATQSGAVNKHGGAHTPTMTASIKTPKYSGKADWEAFHAQFELLAHAGGWSEEMKALQLAMCLAEDALACLLLLSAEERGDYTSLVGALRRRFGLCRGQGLLRSELNNRRRQPGESLRLLANDIESLSRRAYAHMPPNIQCELARDQFLQALTPTELRVQAQLAHPQTLQEALEFTLERELVWAAASSSQDIHTHQVRALTDGAAGADRPAWMDELSELVRSVSLQGRRRRPQPGTGLCWGCGQPGHLVRDCPGRTAQGNGPGSA